MQSLQVLRGFGIRRWAAAAAAAAGTFLMLGVTTAMIPNPVFARPIAAPTWTYPSLVLTSLLAGLLLATYVRPGRDGGGTFDEASSAEARTFSIGGLLAFFAIGCPTCNKLVLIALGASGAITWFEPVQPLLSVAGIAVLVWALNRRLSGEVSCDIPAAPR